MTDILVEIGERVGRAGGPDRELDGAIHNALFGTEYMRSSGSVSGFFTSRTDNGCPYVPAYTASVDAALGLVERLLPGMSWGVDRTDEGDAEPWFDCEIGAAFAQHHTAPLAILAALLIALKSQESSNATE